MGWRRFLGFLAITEATALEIAPAKRLTIERVRRFADHLAETNSPHSVASQMDALYGAARAMIPGQEWTWLRNVKARLYSAAGRKSPAGPVITSVQLVDLGEQLMNESKIVPGSPVKNGGRDPLSRRPDDRGPWVYPSAAQEFCSNPDRVRSR